MHPFTRPLALVALPFAVVACSSVGSIGGGSATTEIPAAIAVPTGSKLAVTLMGAGL